MSKCGRNLIIWIILAATFSFCIYWLYLHHLFMWKRPIVFIWIRGFLQYMIGPWTVTLIICISSWNIGHWFLKGGWWGEHMVRIGIGLGVIAAWVWVLSLANVLYTPLVGVPICVIALFGWEGILKEKWTLPEWRGIPWLEKLVLCAIAWWFLRTVLIACNPSHGFDAIHAHLWQVREYMEGHGHVSDFSMTNIALVHCLTIAQKSIAGLDYGATLQYLSAWMTGGFLYLLGAKYGNRLTGLLAALLWLVSPVAYFSYQQWFTGPFVLMYLMAAMWCLGDQKRILFAGLLCGLACASKTTALISIIFIIPIVWRRAPAFLFWMMVAAVPWYLWNVIEYGNPFWPFKEEWFQWSTVYSIAGIDSIIYSRPVLTEGTFTWMQFWHGMGISSNNPFAQPGELSIVGPFPVALTPFILLVPWKKWTRPALAVLFMVVCGYLYWCFIEQRFHARYMSPILAMHILLGCWALVTICNRDEIRKKHGRWITTTLIAFVLLFSYAVTLKYDWTRAYYAPQDRLYALIQFRPAYPVFQYINDEQPEMRLYQHWFAEYRAWVEFDMEGRRWGEYSAGAYMDFAEGENTAENLHIWLRTFDRTHIFVSLLGEFALPVDDPHWDRYFSPHITFNQYTVWVLDEPGVKPPAPVELILPWQRSYSPQLQE